MINNVSFGAIYGRNGIIERPGSSKFIEPFETKQDAENGIGVFNIGKNDHPPDPSNPKIVGSDEKGYYVLTNEFSPDRSFYTDFADELSYTPEQALNELFNNAWNK